MFRLMMTGLALIGVAGAAKAEPIGRWWSGFGQGTPEYAIKNDSADPDYFYIACPIGEGARIYVTVGGVDPKPRSKVIVTIGGDEIELAVNSQGHIETTSHFEADTFYALWPLIRSGTEMRVRLQSGQSTRFTLKGSSAALPKEPCDTGFALRPKYAHYPRADRWQ